MTLVFITRFFLLFFAVILLFRLVSWFEQSDFPLTLVNEIGRPHEEYADIKSGFGYNLGDLLNMPSFIKSYQKDWPKSGRRDLFNIALSIRDSHPNSVIGRYFKNSSTFQTNGQRLPDPDRLRNVVEEYGRTLTQTALGDYIKETVENPITLLVHVRSCDKKHPHKSFLNYIKLLSKKFQHLILMGQCHNDTRYSSSSNALLNLKFSFDAIAKSAKKTSHVSLFPRATADDHLFAMSRAVNLLAHRGGFSALGALVCRGNVYFSKDMSAFTENKDFTRLVLHPHLST